MQSIVSISIPPRSVSHPDKPRHTICIYCRCKNRVFIRIFNIFAGCILIERTIRKLLKIIWLTIVAITVTTIGGALAIQLPQVQTFAARQFMNRFADKIDGEIAFEKIHLKPFTTLVIKNIAITDKNPSIDPHDPTGRQTDTLFRAEYLIARFTLDGLFRQNGIHIGKAYVNNAQMNLVLENKADEGDGDIVTDNLSRIFRLGSGEKKEPSDDELFHIRKVIVRNMGFAMISHVKDRNMYERGIDWNDLEISGINLNAKELQFKGGIMSGVAESLSFREKSGYVMNKMSGEAKVGRGKTIITDLRMRDLWSDLYLPVYSMSYRSAKDFGDFLSRVKINAEIAKSRLAVKTLSFFAQGIEEGDLVAELSGKTSGYVKDFVVENLFIDSEEGGFTGRINGRMYGLPDISRTRLNINASDFSVTSKGISSFVSAWIPDGELDLSNYGKDIIFMVNAHADGLLDSLHVNTEIITFMSGMMDADVRIDNMISSKRSLGISGSVETVDVDLSRFIDTDLVRQISMTTEFSAKLGNKNEPASLDIRNLDISRLNFMDYDYTNIRAIANISPDMIQGGILSQDPNLNLWLKGGFVLSQKNNNARYHFEGNVGEANLYALNLDKRGKSIVSFDTAADFRRNAKGDISGEINIGDITLENKEGRYNIGDIILTSTTKETGYEMSLNSSFADGYYKGTASVLDFAKELQNVTLKRELPAMFTDSTMLWKGNDYRIHFQCYNTQEILGFALPGLYIEDGTAINASVNEDGIFNADISSGRLAFKKQYLKGLRGRFSNSDDMLSGELSSEEMQIASVMLKNNSFKATADDDQMTLECEFDNHSKLETRGKLLMEGEASRDEYGMGLGIHMKPSSVFLSGKQWEILSSEMNVKGKEADISSFGIVSGNESIRIAGGISQNRKDTLTLALQKFDISLINPVLGGGLGIKGAANGNVQLTSPMRSKGILVDMAVDSTYLAGEPLGTLVFGSTWNEMNETFNITARNDLHGKSNINLHAALTPRTRILEAKAMIDGLDVTYAQPFLSDIFSEMNGQIYGEIDARGPINDLSISSTDTRLEDGEITIAMTNVPYKAQGTFHLNDRGVFFDDITISDRFEGTGKVTGSINYDHFRNMRFNTGITVNQIEAINITENSGDDFYGNIFGTGKISIKGPANSILMEIDAVTAKSGSLHIPMTASASAGKSTNLLKFKEIEVIEEIDPYEIFVRQTKKMEEAESEFAMKMRVNAQPDVEAFIEIDKASGNVLSGRGTGIIELELSKDNFNINGDYTLSSGNYRFATMGLIGKDFQIQDGSSIKFNGDIMESSLDIDAIYNTKVSLSNLIADTTSIANRRSVDCKINITGNISNPRFEFGIEIPDLDPTISSRVQSALSTDDKIQKQFLSLILSNSFLPDEQSGIVNNSSLLYSNVTEVMTNQLNNIFQKLGIPLDMGLNYQPNEKGNDIFDVAISTQLFNNRVVVNGSFGNKEYNSTSNNQNDVVGDLDIEIKLNRPGSFRLNLFSHSADQYTNYLDNSQRNGVGLMYQAEFNNFRQFMKNIFSKKSIRQEAKKKEEQEMLDVEMVTMVITAPDEHQKDNQARNRLIKQLLKGKDDNKPRKTISDSFSSWRK